MAGPEARRRQGPAEGGGGAVKQPQPPGDAAFWATFLLLGEGGPTGRSFCRNRT